tara:strand:+ start:200 stop:607 length:408 start_codon:yes stop_codon:yes gene_type:complete
MFKDRKRTIMDRGPSWPDYNTAEPFMIRYYPLFRKRPKWFPFNIFIHKILKSDRGDLHDHYWSYFTVILAGGYVETTEKGTFNRKPGYMGFRRSTDRHSLKINEIKPAWTLIFVGPNKGSKSHAKYDPNSQKSQQ